MFCKNCGKNIGDSQKELCNECEMALHNTVTETDVVAENTNPIEQNNPINYADNVNNTNTNTNANTNANYVPESQKSKLVAGLLGVLLGAFGVHNFYLGYTGKGIAQLLLTILSCGMLSVVSSIWGVIEGILIFTGEISTDAKGAPLKD